MDRHVMRIVDANLNRLTEGLRVVEDVFRYARDDARLQQELKTMRHRVSSAFSQGPLIASRDAARDVGFKAEGLLENTRASLGDIVRSNLKRVQEACRVLEEVMKLENPDASSFMKEIRYESYQVERDFELMENRVIPGGLFLVLSQTGDECETRAAEAVKAMVPALVLRTHEKSSRAFLGIARSLREITRGTPTRLIVHDRVDVALASGADGVLLEQHSLAPGDARSLAGDSIILGLAAGSLEEVEGARDEPVDYITFGPVFPSPGIDTLKRAVEISRFPVVAEGGIDEGSFDALAGIPLKGVACTGAVNDLSTLVKKIGERA